MIAIVKHFLDKNLLQGRHYIKSSILFQNPNFQ